MEQGLEQGKTLTQKTLIRNLISGFGFTDEQAATAASVSIDFVRQARLEMNEEL